MPMAVQNIASNLSLWLVGFSWNSKWWSGGSDFYVGHAVKFSVSVSVYLGNSIIDRLQFTCSHIITV